MKFVQCAVTAVLILSDLNNAVKALWDKDGQKTPAKQSIQKHRPLSNALRGRCQYLAVQTGSEYSLFVCKGIQEVCHFFLGYSTDHIEIVILVHKGIRIALTVFVE